MPHVTQRRAELGSNAKHAAIRAFFSIGEKWQLSNEDMKVLLGFPSEATFYNWKKGSVRTVPYDTLQRISCVLGIYKALQYLFIQPEQADEWVRKPNSHFGGQTALERMLGGSIVDIAAVRSYLDAERGGH